MHEFFQHEHIRNLPSCLPRAQAPLAAIKGRKWRTVPKKRGLLQSSIRSIQDGSRVLGYIQGHTTDLPQP
jgi:hypothetical protein